MGSFLRLTALFMSVLISGAIGTKLKEFVACCSRYFYCSMV